MENSSALNDLTNYPQLLERSKQIGYEISKVVYRGFHTHDKLQKLHDNAVKTRTNLKIAVSIIYTEPIKYRCVCLDIYLSCVSLL